jgi:hypothetical protein
MKKKIASLLLVFTTLQLFASAQTTGFHFNAPVDNTDSSGFYNIVITPAISAHVKTDYSDLRIANDSGKWVPHLMRWPNTEYVIESLVAEMKIVKIESNDVATVLVVKRVDSITDNLILEFKNSQVERFCSLMGSDDMSHWFAINDSILIKLEKKSLTTNSFAIEFPSCNYQYYRVHIYNQGKGPFDITMVGTSSQEIVAGVIKNLPPHHLPFQNPVPTIIQKDSARQTFIKVTQAASYHFNEFQLSVSAVKYYNRTMDIYIPNAATHSFSNPGHLIQSVSITNNSHLQFRLPTQNAAAFYLIIHNEDNPPLKIDSVKTLYGYTVCTAYFEKGKQYQLLMDNVAAVQPKYDLQQFNIGSKQSLTALPIGNIQNIAQTTTDAAAPNRKWMIWLAITGAALLLAFFTYKLVKDMNKTAA